MLGVQLLRETAARYAVEEGVEDFDELYRSMAKPGRQANLSLFAFTATPKHKTLAIFGRDGEPFHLMWLPGRRHFHKYTMRQAIEEGFILDVLMNYTTYAAAEPARSMAPTRPAAASCASNRFRFRD